MKPGLALAVAACIQAAALSAPLSSEAFFTSKRLPKVGDPVRVGVTLGGEVGELTLPLLVELRASAPEQNAKLIGRQTVTVRPSAEAPVSVAFDWQPAENDWHTLTFTVNSSPPHAATPLALSVRVPVVNRDLYFAWFGSPLQFKWCNVPTTVKTEEEVRLWLRRGAWPCHWKGGVCYKQWPAERFADSYAEHRWIAIDEVGGPGETTDKILAAIREHKRRHPDGFVAVWYMGAHDYWRDVTDAVDLFLPEIYLNYRGNHLGQFEPYLRTARDAGVMGKCVPALGINVVKDKETGEVKASPTKEEVLRQIQHLKRHAPDWPGVGFFTSNSAAPGVAEYADQLCEDYYLDPVLSVGNLEVDSDGGRWLPGAKATVCAMVTNAGGTPARNVHWRARLGEREVASGFVPKAPPGEPVPVEFETALPNGIRVLEVTLGQQQGVTLLDETAAHVVAGLPALAQPEVRLAALSPAPIPRDNTLVSLETGLGGSTVTEVDASGAVLREVPASVRPTAPTGEEGRLQFVAVGETPADARRFFVLRPGPEQRTVTQGAAETVALQRDAYRAEVRTRDGALTSLRVNGGQTELLARPWTFKCTGHSGWKQATIAESALATEVTVPFESAEASGATRLTFYHAAPLIEVARRFVPKGTLTLKAASEGCNLAQRGGTFALQPGVGGPVKRGRLQDGKEYRDLLFGYLGERPRPDNADKCGWFDFSWPKEDDAGLGIVLARRWQDAATESYDVTRYYDAGDWLQINYLWKTETKLTRPQESVVYLLPHGSLDMTNEATAPPAQALWETLHTEVEWANAQRPVR